MRRVVSRLLLVLLAVAVAVVVWRTAAGGRGGAVVALDRLHAEQLRHEAFSLSGTARLAVDAVGSFEERPDTALAALGWIVRRSDGAVVWRQRAGTRPARGLVSAVRDTLVLAEGTYDAYFASFGDPLLRAAAAPAPDADPTFGERIRESLSRGGRAWQGEAGRWHLVVRGATSADRARARALGDDDPARADPAPDVVWASGALGNDTDESTLLRVTAPADVRLEAVFESTGGTAESAALVRVGGDRDTVWTSRGAAASWAGGALTNRRARATVRLAPGLYRAAARTDDAHAAGRWSANPPWAPWTWGLTVRRAGGPAGGPPESVAVLDPEPLADEVAAGTSRLPVVAEMRCVGTDQTAEVAFALTAPAEVLLVAQGEITSDGEYDVATLLRGRERVWEMTRSTTEPAGGNDKNRRASASLSLAPGDYVLRYTTDGSYDCTDRYDDDDRDDWPDAPDFWGASVVLLDPSSATSVRRPPAPPRPPAPSAFNGALVAFARVGNDARLDASFTLDGDSELRVVAVGELLTDDRLDYGWIEDARGEVVWEMTRGNTRPAGGSPKNRIFEGGVRLPAGRYTARYVSNGRHAYGAFEDGVPDDVEAWGLRIDAVGAPSERL